jgi:fluoroacetyl-CoA thioesterase
MEDLVVGLKGEKTLCVNEYTTALALGSGGLEVLGTPALAALMEGAAFDLVQAHLPAGTSSVGTRLELDHLAATPLGMQVTATAELIALEGRKLVFAIEARDHRELVGKAVHERFMVQIDKFMSKVQAKF